MHESDCAEKSSRRLKKAPSCGTCLHCCGDVLGTFYGRGGVVVPRAGPSAQYREEHYEAVNIGSTLVCLLRSLATARSCAGFRSLFRRHI